MWKALLYFAVFLFLLLFLGRQIPALLISDNFHTLPMKERIEVMDIIPFQLENPFDKLMVSKIKVVEFRRDAGKSSHAGCGRTRFLAFLIGILRCAIKEGNH